ncbi:MAG: hypothetical protein K9J13_15735 [Saprospiraceae bacterium]|nr:hypothetical protein [Saprospiraceae bacterium]
MKKIILLIIGLIAVIGLHAQYNLQNLQPKYQELKVSTDNLIKIYPIKANKVFTDVHKDVSKFTNLETAIKQNKIIVTEVSSSGTVNTLFAENISKETIYLMAGEVIKGGKQDRIIGSDVIILPGEKKNISAFCVERGRWSAQGSGDKFDGYSNGVSQNVRKAAVVDKNQSEVWSNVSQVNSSNNISSSTGAYTALEKSKTYNDKMQSYLKVFKSAWNNDPSVVGIVAVSGDKVIGCDIFATHDIFVNAYNNLLHSYITEAISNGSKVTITMNEVNKYLEDFLKDESKQEESLNNNGDVFKHGANKLHISVF